MFDELWKVLNKGIDEIGTALIQKTTNDISGGFSTDVGYTKPNLQPNMAAQPIGGAVYMAATPGGNAVPVSAGTIAGITAQQLVLGLAVLGIGFFIVKG